MSSILLGSSDLDLETSVRRALSASPSFSHYSLDARSLASIADSPLPLNHAVFLLHLSKADCPDQAISLLREKLPATILISDEYDCSQALAFLKHGVVDYLGRPLDIRRLSTLIDFITWQSCLPGVSVKSTANVPDCSFVYDPSEELICELLRQVKAVASKGATVLFTGETGTGKSHLARLIHESSPRKDHPFSAVNCATLVPSLIASELFGHAKGAFTGADSEHMGTLETVGEGTLLLDEIDSLSLESQAKLLRAIDERVFERVGSSTPIPFRARLVVATNRDLEADADSGRFRKDLFYRVNVVSLDVPPLRDRGVVIPQLTNRFLAEFCARDKLPVPAAPQETMSALQNYDWPGNIRELRNVIERSIALCTDSVIRPSDLPPQVAACACRTKDVQTKPAQSLQRRKKEAEAKFIKSALENSGNNRSRAARELGISRVTLYKKLHKYGLI